MLRELVTDYVRICFSMIPQSVFHKTVRESSIMQTSIFLMWNEGTSSHKHRHYVSHVTSCV